MKKQIAIILSLLLYLNISAQKSDAPKILSECLTFDIDSKALVSNPGGSLSKTIILKKCASAPELKGKLTMEITVPQSSKVYDTQTFDVDMKKGESAFTFQIKKEFSGMERTFSFIDSKTGQRITPAKKKLFNETPEEKNARMAWWVNDRFGMFIHWGLYALPARHEWVKYNERISEADYKKYFDLFNPDLFNPKEWAREAKAAGMKYAVLTAKHHEGFCLFASKFTDYNAVNTPAKRDLVREFVDAFRAEGIKVGFYYSLLDWHDPNCSVDKIHPLHPNDESPTAYAALNKNRDMNKFRQLLKGQITELLTNYGKIDVLWFDPPYDEVNGVRKTKEDWDSEGLMKLVRKLQPDILVNNRLGLSEYADGADFTTPEQSSASDLKSTNVLPFETCQTFSGSWGYNRDENSWKSNHELLELLISSVSKGGNLLLNVGPTARGAFDYRAVTALDSIVGWMKYNNKAIYGCTQAPAEFKTPDNCLLTFNPETKRLYVHLMKYPQTLTLPDYCGKIKYAQFLHDNSELKFKESGTDVIIILPERKPNIQVPVIEILLK